MTRLRVLLTIHWRWLFVVGAYTLVAAAFGLHVCWDTR